ncbi:hypothetical protein SKAU_G00418310 [Synaphobranchus kaupii]|uniref:Ig-like domain-containing protein n=1 Tax=Synaphobranchus kaupii TaxID=118154 RepID=A0A9Q1E6C3_SYNKA|nr:hypothetical protein SKAU_G00418310 [Synaphobranchus kaupii]
MTATVYVLLFISATGWEISVPSRVTVDGGVCLHIPCTFTPPQGTAFQRLSGTWEKDGHVVSSHHFDIFSEDHDDYSSEYDNRARVRWTGLNQPRVEVHPVILKEDELATLACYTRNQDCPGKRPSITWEGLSGRKEDQEVSSEIKFMPTRRDNGRQVTCRVQYSGGIVTSRNVTLTVQYTHPTLEITGQVLPKPVISLTPERVQEGDALTLSCILDSRRPGNISLHRLGETQPLKHGIATQLSLTLPSVSRKDSGEYSCLSQQGQATEKSSVQVLVMYGPEITDETVCVKRYGALLCLCFSRGVPPPTIEWRGLRVDSDLLEVTNGVWNDTAESTVALRNDSVQAVTCVSRNHIGKDSRLLQAGSGETHIETCGICHLWVIVGFFLNVPIIFVLFCIYAIHKRLTGKKQQETELNDTYTILDNTTMSPDYDIIRRATAN